jgi:hypothetical protein
MCALVLALRRIPILGPGGGGAPLGDPSNPAYSVTIPDEVAAAAREKAAKDADAARLHPTISAQSKGGIAQASPAANRAEPVSPMWDSLTADAMNGLHLGQNALRDEEKEADKFDVVGTQRPLAELSSSGTDSALNKISTPQGRRRPGLTAPTIVSTTSRQTANGRRVASQSVASKFDQEPQRRP